MDVAHRITTREVLLAEPDPLNRHAAELALRRFGCSVDVATSLADAESHLARTAYDAVVVNPVMPDADDELQAIRRLRATRSGSTIIATTAVALVGEGERCRRAGADFCLIKPYRPSALRALLEEHISGA